MKKFYAPSWLVSLMIALVTGCATPGAPQAPSLRVPQLVTDLEAIRKGDDVYLRWTVPTKTTDGQSITHIGKTRLCRGYVTDEQNSCKDVVEEMNTFADPHGFEEATDHVATLVGGAKDFLTYRVKVNNDVGRNSGVSNAATVFLAPSVAAPANVNAHVMPHSVEIDWEATELPLSPNLKADYFYRIWRTAEDAALKKNARLIVGEVPATPGHMVFNDKNFDWEKSYAYRVTGVTRVMAHDGSKLAEFEGEDSRAVLLVTHDIFPPMQPVGVQAVFSEAGNKRFIDLTWSPDNEDDLSGYNLYRREAGGSQQAVKINADLIQTPSFRDSNVSAGKTYIYTVSAVDVRGNESQNSEPAHEKVPE